MAWGFIFRMREVIPLSHGQHNIRHLLGTITLGYDQNLEQRRRSFSPRKIHGKNSVSEMSRRNSIYLDLHERPAKTQISLTIIAFTWRSMGTQGPKTSSDARRMRSLCCEHIFQFSLCWENMSIYRLCYVPAQSN